LEVSPFFSFEHRVAGRTEEPLYYSDDGRTMIDYNTNTITRVTSTTINGQHYPNIVVFEILPIQEYPPTIDHYWLRISCSFLFNNNQGLYNNQEFFIYRAILYSISNQP